MPIPKTNQTFVSGRRQKIVISVFVIGIFVHWLLSCYSFKFYILHCPPRHFSNGRVRCVHFPFSIFHCPFHLLFSLSLPLFHHLSPFSPSFTIFHLFSPFSPSFTFFHLFSPPFTPNHTSAFNFSSISFILLSFN